MDFIDDFIDRKFGTKETIYLHPELEPILKETHGIIVYQEQVIQIANKVGRMSLGEADLLRRAMGKKDLKAMADQKIKFVTGAQSGGISAKIAEEIFEAIDKFANYGFNKSHAVAYSYVAYQTAYLKAHYTPEFLAANLTNEFGNKNKVSTLLEDCRKLKIEILPPDVNHPTVYFDVDDGKIRFGMSAIKNVGIAAVEEIIRSRQKLERPYSSIFEFCANVDTRIVNKRVLEGLVYAGAFDSINKKRADLFAAIEEALDFGSRLQTSNKSVENSLFGNISETVKIQEPVLKSVERWPSRDSLAREREVTGFYVTGHPLTKYEIEYKSFATIHLGETEELEEIENARACGVITDLKTKMDKSGRTMAFFTLDDFSGSCECLMFAKTYEKFGKFIKEEDCVFIVGNTESSGDAIKLHINEVIPLKDAKEKFTASVNVFFEKAKNNPETIAALKAIFDKHTGKLPVYLHFFNNGSKPRVFFLNDYRVKISDEFVKEVLSILGEDSILFGRK
jgi:DNA polymerase-3 subunit alpha